MSDDLAFDALELARRANPEIDDMRREARERMEAHQLAPDTGDQVKAALLRAFRALAKGG